MFQQNTKTLCSLDHTFLFAVCILCHPGPIHSVSANRNPSVQQEVYPGSDSTCLSAYQQLQDHSEQRLGLRSVSAQEPLGVECVSEQARLKASSLLHIPWPFHSSVKTCSSSGESNLNTGDMHHFFAPLCLGDK